MRTVTSQDGTTIAFDEYGEGPTVILVDGALGVRNSMMGHQWVAQLLADAGFRGVNYDRRGRGDSTDTPPYAVAREWEDIEALIDDAGGTAYLYGISSGALLALEAANALPNKVTKLALYEPPFIVDDSRPPLPADYVQHLQALIAEDRRGDAVTYFMTTAVGVPEEYLAPMQADPSWKEMEALAHTISYDGTIMADRMSGKPLPADAWPNVTMPTLIMTGGESDPFFADAVRALALILPNAERRTLEGQSHGVSPDALTPALVTFFGA